MKLKNFVWRKKRELVIQPEIISDQERKRLQRIEEERMSKEERERLKDEVTLPKLISKRSEVIFWDETVMGISKQSEREYKKRNEEQKISSFDEAVDPMKESDLTTFYNNFEEKVLSGLNDIPSFLKKIQEAEEIVKKLNVILLNFKIANDYERIDWCIEYIKKLRDLSLKRITEFTGKIAIVKEIDLRKDSDILIDQKLIDVANNPDENSYKQNFKGDERLRYEVMAEFDPTTDFKFGVWLNPNSKMGFRHKPVDFVSLDLKCEIPRPFMTIQVIMKALWTSFDPFTVKFPFRKDFIVVFPNWK